MEMNLKERSKSYLGSMIVIINNHNNSIHFIADGIFLTDDFIWLGYAG